VHATASECGVERESIRIDFCMGDWPRGDLGQSRGTRRCNTAGTAEGTTGYTTTDMAGEPILIVDDTPVNLKLTRILLVNEGYKVLTAASAEEALELLRSYRPRLILADIQLPGIDGLEMTRRIKMDERTRHIPVVALTAFALKGDEQKAIDAGCDGYITKPIDTHTLGERIRRMLSPREDAAALPDPEEAGIPGVELRALRRRFLSEGQERARQLLLDLDGALNAAEAARTMHQWVGTSGLLGYTALGRLAREIETQLMERPVDTAQLRESLTNLVLGFAAPREERDAAVPEAIASSLLGKNVAIVGLPAHETERLCVALERAEARAHFYELSSPPETAIREGCDLIVVYVRADTANSGWLNPRLAAKLPTVFVGSRDDMLELEPAVQGMAAEFLMDSWQPDEALVRLSLAFTHVAATPPAQAVGGPMGSPRVLIAEDDATTLTLVRMHLENFGMECQTASDGPTALEMARRLKLDAAILDVDMPGMDGYEVLSAIRRDGLPLRIILLTARQWENDILRGFTLGADDYMVKPFSPMELLARLSRLLAR
jgi:two-component system, cell cycle response regulator DivK